MNPRRARHLAPALVALATLTSTLSAAPAATAESPTARADGTVTIEPATLARGENPAIPQLLGTRILDGDLRIELDAREVQLLGKSDDDYVAGVWRDGSARVQRVSADGDRATIMDRINGDLTLSSDGDLVFETLVRSGARSVVTVRDSHTGDRLTRRTFRGYVRVLDADQGRAILGASSPRRTLAWRPRTGATSRIAAREGYFADIRADRVAGFTGRSDEGGCSVLTTLSSPREALWRSCERAVVAASPNGRRVATWDIGQDGPVTHVVVHNDHGRRIVGYRSSGSFASWAWETNRSLLLQTYGPRKAAVVRCEGETCERASERIDS